MSGPRILFLPGAAGSDGFWRPVAALLDPGRRKHFFAWPGLGNEPPAGVRSLDDLVKMVVAELIEPADIVAQSMGGVVALRALLAAPDKVRRLVLAGTSGGLPVTDLGGRDWRDTYRKNFPHAAAWIAAPTEDLSWRIATAQVPTLLLWGSADSISPPAVGERLAALMPRARLHIVSGGDHDFPQTQAAAVAPLIAQHLNAC